MRMSYLFVKYSVQCDLLFSLTCFLLQMGVLHSMEDEPFLNIRMIKFFRAAWSVLGLAPAACGHCETLKLYPVDNSKKNL